MATFSDVSLDRGLPASVEAERSILGAILLDNHSYNEAAEKLRADDFSLDSHRRIYSRMSELIDARRAVDIVTLAEELARRKEVEAVGGVAYLASLTEGLAAAAEHRRVRPHREGQITVAAVHQHLQHGHHPGGGPKR